MRVLFDLEAVQKEAQNITLPTTLRETISSSALKEAVAELFTLVDERAHRIVRRRFGLDGAKPQTLHAIGEKEGVTRERIRQIENVILKTFRTSTKLSSRFQNVRNAVHEALAAMGGIARVEVLGVALGLQAPEDVAALRLLVVILPDTREYHETERMRPHVELKETIESEAILDRTRAILESAKKPLTDEELFSTLKNAVGSTLSETALRSVLSVSNNIIRTPFNEWGLKSWAEALPRSVGDKAYVVLKRHGSPMHFSDITKSINGSVFGSRAAHSQTVHNELIRDARFVLVGRGLYALQEWGYEPGTVLDVLKGILRDAKKPMTREELLEAVLKKRMVKRNTILLALHNKSQFTRHANGAYQLANENTSTHTSMGATHTNARDLPTKGSARGNS